ARADETKTSDYSPLSPQYPRTSTGRRRALALWMTRPDNPLTARVAVNHIWMRHFHQPLVSSVYDFGRNGAKPTHPELLDWLAVEFVDSGWSMKHLHKLIVTSATYRRVSSAKGASQWHAIDPENQQLWRMNSGRMEAEVVRDSLLFCGDMLESKMGGQELENSEALTTFRRSLYYSVHPEEGGKNPLGEWFDAPNALECYRRTRSIVPQQALALTNSDLIHAMSERIVKDTFEIEDSNALIINLFERILSRQPSDAELQVCAKALTDQLRLANDAKHAVSDANLKARQSLVRALLNHNDFITIR
ncbi:MAG: DUF1553 domain-containing protein, partial [Planctomycetaceae bacterium]|nr:DUF1553 domain-containing protein [Planctomycetaceae bacterium]